MNLIDEDILSTLLGGVLVILGSRIQIINQKTNQRREVCIAFSIVVNRGLRVVKELHKITQDVKTLENDSKNKRQSEIPRSRIKKNIADIYTRINKLRAENEEFEVEMETVLARLEHLTPLYVRRIALKLVSEIYSYNGTIESQDRIEMCRAKFVLVSKFSYQSQIKGWLAYRSSKNMK